MKKSIALACVLIAASSVCAANTWYVDDDNYGKEGLDGTSREKAFGTIQDAIDAEATKAGDTIKVYPGVYDKGQTNLVTSSGDYGSCRVLAHKTVTIESVDGATTTHIVGEWDPDTESGRGPNAVRCIGQNSTKPVFKGFTIRNGATNLIDEDGNGTEDDKGVNRGGAVYSVQGNSPTYIVDCVISNCTSAQGTFRNGCVIRSLVCGNKGMKGVGGMQTTFYSCIITGNQSGGSLISDSNTSLAHCTVYGNATYTSVSGATTAKNNIIVLSFSKSDVTDLSGTTLSGNALACEHGEYQMIAPAAGDFRVLKGSVAETICASDPADGSELVRAVPEEFRGKDFYGNPITENCVAGAVQEVAEAAGGALRFEGLSSSKAVFVNGWRNIKSGAYVFPAEYPIQYKVTPGIESGKLYAWDTSIEHGNFHMPDSVTDTVYLMPPPQTGAVMTNTMMVATGEIWLDPQNGSDEDGDGSMESPYRTLQKGVDASDSARTFVYCKKGIYAEGGTNYHWGVTNRVLIGGSKNVRFVAVDGANETFIEGSSDQTHTEAVRPGCGPAAMRAICVAAGSPISGFEGFTFRNCFTDSQEEGESNTVGFQGAVFRTTGDSFTLMDCVISNCASASSLFCNGRIIRCHALGMQNISQPCDTTIASGCLLENNASSDREALGKGAHVTLRNSGGMLQNYACIASGGKRVNRAYAGSIMYGFDVYEAGDEGYVTDDPRFASTEGAKILRSSPAFVCGEKPTADNYGTNYYKYATTDFYGRPIMFVDGKPVAGADQFGVFSMLEKRAFEVAEATSKALETSSGTIILPEGDGIKASRTASADANAPGYWIVRFTVPEGGSLSVTVDGTETIYEAGTHEHRLAAIKTGIGSIKFLSLAGTTEVLSLFRRMGTVMTLR